MALYSYGHNYIAATSTLYCLDRMCAHRMIRLSVAARIRTHVHARTCMRMRACAQDRAILMEALKDLPRAEVCTLVILVLATY